MTRRRFLGVAAVLAAVVLLALAWSPSEVQAVNRSSSTLPTPMWSLRRVPHPIIERINQQRYQSVLDPYMTRYGQSCFVVSRGGTVIAAHDPDVSLLPASTQKLMTAVTALKVLGPEDPLSLELTDGSKPALFKSGNDYQYLVMPLS